MKKLYFLTGLQLLLTAAFYGIQLPVPSTYTSIQLAVNAANNGDTVVVSPGTYYENINFRGKNIVVTSLYFQAQNTSFISSTIINGSNPVFADTASCVIFNSGETQSAILQGFTITGGKGTKWFDIHGAGTYREGGGILIELSSPTIKHNIIANNTVTNTAGVTNTGGGGIRIGDGNPLICSNAILSNRANYGPGIVLNYTGVKLTNNVIASNTGGSAYNGGSGIWAVNNLTNTPILIENNTITNNSSSLNAGTGGILVSGCNNTSIRNNIIYGNFPALQLKSVTSTISVTYNDIQGGYTGTTNINVNPQFAATNYSLVAGSLCIDAGDPSAVFNDISDPSNPQNALLPSQGTLTNDMGAFGGPCTSGLPVFNTVTGIETQIKFENNISVYPNPFTDHTFLELTLKNTSNIRADIYDILGNKITMVYKGELNSGIYRLPIDCQGLIPGTYFLSISGENLKMTKKLIVTE